MHGDGCKVRSGIGLGEKEVELASAKKTKGPRAPKHRSASGGVAVAQANDRNRPQWRTWRVEATPETYLPDDMASVGSGGKKREY